MDGCGAGHALVGRCGSIGGRGQLYGNALLLPLLGGSGGSGGQTGGGSVSIAGGGGAGGGALRVFSSVSITANGTISANGGSGGSGATGGIAPFLNGGGGSGGGIHLIAPIVSGSGVLSAIGGGDGVGGVLDDGSVGRIRVDATQQNFAGTSDPPASLGTPFNVPLPVGSPQIRVTSVGGEAVPATPTGSFTMPDVSIDQANALAVEIEARNIPVGTVAQVHVFSEAGPNQTIDSTPLAGTNALSIATAQVTFPPGFSRGFVRAVFSPPSP